MVKTRRTPRNRVSAEAQAITSGPTLEHLRRRRRRRPTPSPFEGLDDLFELESNPFSDEGGPSSGVGVPMNFFDASPPSPVAPPSPAAPPSPLSSVAPVDASVMQRGWKRFVKANLRKMKDPLRATIQDKDELHRAAMQKVGEAWRNLSMEDRLEIGTMPVGQKEKQKKSAASALKLNPFTGEQMTRSELRDYMKDRKKANKQDRDEIYKRLKNFNKTTVRRSVARLKKMFRGPPGHWKAAYPLKSLAATYSKVSNACDRLANKGPGFLLPPDKQHQYVPADPDYDEDEEIQL